jgi:antigen flippase
MQKEDNSYKHIFRSLGFIGGSQIIIIFIGIIRTKIIAILLGPNGVGIVGIFQNLIDLVRNATSFGINYSGVKKIAEVASEVDSNKTHLTIKILRSWALATGVLGMLLMILFSSYFSFISFSTTKYTYDIILLSIVILFSSVSAGQLALLQGLRKIKEMAKASIAGAFLGTFVSLPLYWYFGLKGIVAGIIFNSVISFIVSWYFAQKIKIKNHVLSLRETYMGGIDMAKTGIFVVFTMFMSSVFMYLIRSHIVKNADVATVGLFQSVWTISTLYLNVLLNAMLADYFPRLSELSDNNFLSNKLINEQLEITILTGTPMLILMLTLGSASIKILYTNSFVMALPILQWQIFSSFFTLLIWPLGVLFLARNKGKYMLFSELIKQTSYFLIIYYTWKYFGFASLGYGFFISILFTLIFTIYSVYKITHFSFNRINIKNINNLLILIVLNFLSLQLLNGYIQIAMNFSILIITIFYCFKQLNHKINFLSVFKKIK